MTDSLVPMTKTASAGAKSGIGTMRLRSRWVASARDLRGSSLKVTSKQEGDLPLRIGRCPEATLRRLDRIGTVLCSHQCIPRRVHGICECRNVQCRSWLSRIGLTGGGAGARSLLHRGIDLETNPVARPTTVGHQYGLFAGSERSAEQRAIVASPR